MSENFGNWGLDFTRLLPWNFQLFWNFPKREIASLAHVYRRRADEHEKWEQLMFLRMANSGMEIFGISSGPTWLPRTQKWSTVSLSPVIHYFGRQPS